MGCRAVGPMIPHVFDRDIGARLQALDEARRVNMPAADERDSSHRITSLPMAWLR